MSYVVLQKAGGGRVYAQLAENHHIPELQQARQTRKHLGVIDPVTGELRLASGLPEPDQSLLMLLTRAGVAYHGKRSPPRGRQPQTGAMSRRQIEAEDGAAWIEELGDVHVMCLLAKESGLDSALRGALGEKDGLAVLWAAAHQACTGEPQYLASEWLDGRKLPDALSEFDFSSPGLSSLSEALGRAHTCRQRFLGKWIEACGKPEAIILDTTSLSTYSDNLETAEWGHNRDKESLPQVNFSLAIGAIGHLPLAYRTNFGSIPDVATLQATNEFLKEYGLKRITYSTDKGFWSNSNAAAMLKEKMKFVMGVPQISLKAKALVKKHRRKLDTPKCSLLYGEHVVRHAWDKWTVDMPDKTKEELDVILFMEPERVADQVADIERKTLDIVRIASEMEFASHAAATQWLGENAKALARYFSISDATHKFTITRKCKAVAQRCNALGVSIYATNCKKLAEDDILAVVRGRDAVEKVFDLIKNEDGQKRLRTGSDDRMEGRLFLAFVAAILHVLMENRMRKANLLASRSVPEALAMLRKIRRIHFASGRILMPEIPKKTRKLLEAMGIALPK
jgi:transposase